MRSTIFTDIEFMDVSDDNDIQKEKIMVVCYFRRCFKK